MNNWCMAPDIKKRMGIGAGIIKIGLLTRIIRYQVGTMTHTNTSPSLFTNVTPDCAGWSNCIT